VILIIVTVHKHEIESFLDWIHRIYRIIIEEECPVNPVFT
jgi:hypothetical protein